MERKIQDRQLFSKVLEECVCDKATAVLMRTARVGNLEVSLWLSQTDEGDDVSYAVKLKHRGVFGSPGEQLRDEDVESIGDAFCWALSELFERSICRRWLMPKS